MVAVVGSLLVELLADNSKLKQGLSAAGHDITGLENRSRQTLGRMDSRFAGTFAGIGRGSKVAFGALATAAVGVLVPLLSVSAAINGAKEALTAFDKIGKSAKSGGLDAETFQEYAYAAELAGVGTDKLSAALDAFNRNAGRASANKGELVENLRVLNPELLKSIQLATSQQERFRLMSDAIRDESDASKQAALAAAAFGDAGVKMVEMLKGGSAALDETARKARDLGIIVSRDLIANAETMNDKFSTAQKVIDIQFKSALINLAPWLISSTQLVGGLANAVNVLVDQFKAVEERTVLRPLQNQLVDFENKIHALKAEIAADEANIAALGSGNPSAGMLSFSLPAKKAELESYYQEALRLQDRIARLQGMGSTPTTPLDLPEVPTLPGTGDAAAKAAIKQAESVAQLIANLEHEQDQLLRTAAEQELYNLLKSAGVDRESEFGRAIEAALTPLQAQREALEANKKAMEEFGSLAKDTMSTFVSSLREGKSFTDSLSDAFGRLSDRLIDMAMDTAISGPFSNLERMAA